MTVAPLRALAGALAVVALGLSGAALGAERGGQLVELTLGPGTWSPPTSAEGPPTTLPVPAAAPSLPPPDPFVAPFSQVFAGVVRIRALEPGSLGVGTGFVVGDGTWLLTNRHVVEGAAAVELETWDGRPAGTGTLAAVAPSGADLALLRVDGPPLAPMALSLDRPASSTDAVVTAGYPGGRLLVRSTGTVELLARNSGSEVLVTDLACEPGCSGSPVLGADGRVVGVIVGGTAAAKTIAIPIGQASELLAAQGIAA